MMNMTLCGEKWLVGNPGFYSRSDFVVGQKVRATYNVTAPVQIGLSILDNLSQGEC
jgi:hypothetical protein